MNLPSHSSLNSWSFITGETGIIISALVSISALVIVVMAIFYFRSKSGEKVQSDTANPTQSEGVFFKRYVPESQQQNPVLDMRPVEPEEKRTGGLGRMKWGLTIMLIFVFILGIVVSLFSNKHRLSMQVSLNEEDMRGLVFTRHEWEKNYPETLPDLQKELLSLKGSGLVLVSDKGVAENNEFTKLNQDSRNHWKVFAHDNDLKITQCSWDKIKKCQAKHKGWVFVVLPSYWQHKELESLFSQGESVLLYDAPLQVASEYTTGEFSLYGLHFTRFLDKSGSKLSLVGDRELSLGFDAGTIIDIDKSSSFYTVSSEYPQALAIDSGHRAGGRLTTRLYAKAVNEGRLVWMDFSPNTKSHEGIDEKYFSSVVASIFRYLGKSSYQAVATWPEGKRFAAMVEEDVVDGFSDTAKVINFFNKKNYPITWNMVSNVAQQNPALTRKMAQVGQVACYGDHDLPLTLSDAKTQSVRVARCRKMLQHITGNEVQAFRPPEEKYTQDTLDALINNGITHYVAEQGTDRFVPIINHSTITNKSLVSLPRMVADDLIIWNKMKVSGVAEANRITQNEMEYVEAVGGLYLYSFRADTGSGSFSAVQHIANLIHKKEAFFGTAAGISDWWKFRSGLVMGKAAGFDELERFKPRMLKVGLDGKVSSYAYSGDYTVVR